MHNCIPLQRGLESIHRPMTGAKKTTAKDLVNPYMAGHLSVPGESSTIKSPTANIHIRSPHADIKRLK